MNYAEIKLRDVANGPGVRVNLFVSGCEHHCFNCFNKETWDFNYGKPFTKNELDEIIKGLQPQYMEGLTILGGEPLHPNNIHTVANVCEVIRNIHKHKSIWIYTGYTIEQLIQIYNARSNNHEALMSILNNIDVMVDGPFVEELKDLNLKFRGSSNQRILDIRKMEFKDNILKGGFIVPAPIEVPLSSL